MSSKFQYKPRSAESLEKRGTMSGSTFIGYIQDKFPILTVGAENWIRPLPPTWVLPQGVENYDHYGMDIWVHARVGPQNAYFLCLLKMKNKACPVCEEYERAKESGKETAAKFKPTRRVLAWFINRKLEGTKDFKGPELWAMPWTVDRDISAVCKDKQTGELFQLDNPDEGYNVSFDKKGKELNTEYFGYQVDRRSSSVDAKYLDFVIENPLPSVLIFRNYDEMADIFQGGAPAPSKESQTSAPAAPAAPADPLPSRAAAPAPAAQAAPPPAPVQAAPAQAAPAAQVGFCQNVIKFKGIPMGCILAAGHPDYPDSCDFSRDIPAAAPAAQAAPALCKNKIKAKGRWLGCALSDGHTEDDDFSIDLGEVLTPAAPPAAAPASALFPSAPKAEAPTEPAAAPAAAAQNIGSRAEQLRSRLTK